MNHSANMPPVTRLARVAAEHVVEANPVTAPASAQFLRQLDRTGACAKGAFARSHGLKFFSLEHYEKKGGLDGLLIVLEMFARLGLINRYPLLISHLDWLQAQQGKDGKWNLPTKMMHDNSRWTTLLRIEKDWRSPSRKEADMTFRALLILKYQFERQIRMLDRRDDGYPI